MQKVSVRLAISTFGLACTLFGCSEEQNPYRGNYLDRAANGKTGNQAGNVSDSNTNADATPAPSPASAGSIPTETFSGAQVACKSDAITQNFQAELDVLCIDKQPTQMFATLIKDAYKGVGQATVTKIKSEDNNGVSNFVLATSFEIPTNFASAVKQRLALATTDFVEGSATFSRVLVSEIPAGGGNDLGGAITRDSLAVKVAFITVTDVRITEARNILLKDGSAMLTLASLKQGEADNSDNTVANILSLMISDGATTKLIAVTHQEVNNRGQAATAETTALNIARRMTEEARKKFTP